MAFLRKPLEFIKAGIQHKFNQHIFTIVFIIEIINYKVTGFDINSQKAEALEISKIGKV